MNILEEIRAQKQKELNALSQNAPLGKTQSDTRLIKDFKQALCKPGLSVIAEVKKASPTKGVLKADFDPVAIAKSYAQEGADALSVLTDKHYFQGDIAYIQAIKEQVDLPILRKDFIIQPQQVRETYNSGADAILLIVALLKPALLQQLLELAMQFGLMPLVEVHNAAELGIAVAAKSPVIGVNNRDLKSFTTDLQTSINLKAKIPKTAVAISESGIHTTADCQTIYNHGFDAVLAGEALVQESIPGQKIRAWKKVT